MWVVKGLLFLILLFVLVYFFATNSDQSVDLNVFGRAYLGINIYWVVAACYLAGFATSFVLAAVRELRFHREIGQLRKAAKAKDQRDRRAAHAAPARRSAAADRAPAVKGKPPVRTGPPEGAAP